MMLLRLDSKRDSEAVSGRMARMRVTGRVERTLRKRACFSGDTWGRTEDGVGLKAAAISSLLLLESIRLDRRESARTANSESQF